MYSARRIHCRAYNERTQLGVKIHRTMHDRLLHTIRYSDVPHPRCLSSPLITCVRSEAGGSDCPSLPRSYIRSYHFNLWLWGMVCAVESRHFPFRSQTVLFEVSVVYEQSIAKTVRTSEYTSSLLDDLRSALPFLSSMLRLPLSCTLPVRSIVRLPLRPCRRSSPHVGRYRPQSTTGIDRLLIIPRPLLLWQLPNRRIPGGPQRILGLPASLGLCKRPNLVCKFRMRYPLDRHLDFVITAHFS